MNSQTDIFQFCVLPYIIKLQDLFQFSIVPCPITSIYFFGIRLHVTTDNFWKWPKQHYWHFFSFGQMWCNLLNNQLSWIVKESIIWILTEFRSSDFLGGKCHWVPHCLRHDGLKFLPKMKKKNNLTTHMHFSVQSINFQYYEENRDFSPWPQVAFFNQLGSKILGNYIDLHVALLISKKCRYFII